MKLKDKTRQSVQLTIEYGSNFQEEMWVEYLDTVLKSVKECMESAHKDNKFNIINFCYKNNPMDL